MPKGKYTAADVAPDAGTMPNAGPMGKYSAADVADAPPPTDDDTLTNIIGGAASRVGSYITGAMPHSLSEVVAGPMSGIGIARTQLGNIKRSAEDVFSGEPNRVGRGVVQGVAPGMGTGSLYDMATSGKTPEAVGAGGVDALALMLPELEKGAGAIADSASHPIIKGAGRVVRDFDITKPFKSVGDNVVAPAAEKFSQWRQGRNRPQLQSPLDPSAGVKVAPGAPVAQPRIASPAEDLISAMDNESAVRRAPDTSPAPPQVRVKHVQEGIQSPLEPGTGTVAPRQFGDAPVSADASHIPTLADEMVGPLEQGEGTVAPRSMQPTADMNTGGGGANYSADDLANLISKHNIPPAPGEIAGGGAPNIVDVYHATPELYGEGIRDKGIRPGSEVVEENWQGDPPLSQVYLHDNLPSAREVGRFREGDLGLPHNVLKARVNKARLSPANEFNEGFVLPPGEGIAPEDITSAFNTDSPFTNSRDDAAILQAMREDLDAHGGNALHEESTDFAARNKVGKGKTGKPGYGFNRKLPEAGQ